MKKFGLICILCLFLCVPFCFVGCEKGEENLNVYKITASYDENSHTLECSQSTTFFNNTENALSQVCFFLYPNAFEEGREVVAKSYFDRAYANGESYGNITFQDIKISDQNCNYEISDNHNILTIFFEKDLFPTESAVVSFEYIVNLANINHRLGYGENTVNFGGFFPVVCVYENGYIKNDFAQNGDPFYSDIANFEVEITYPSDYILASSGVQRKNGDSVICEAQRVRDFCFILSKEFSVLTDYVGETEIKYYYYDDANCEKHLSTSKKAVETFNTLFGEYPYKQLSVVKTNFCFGGMEYPNLVMISDDIEEDITYDYVIAHEIAHQWWYGMVGNNEFSQSWLDESLTEYSTLLFFEKNADYGIGYQESVDNTISTYKKFVQVYSDILGSVDESMNRDLNHYATDPEYVNCIYTKGVILYDSLRENLGDKKFFKCLRNYFEEFQYKNASSQDLIDSFSKTSKRNLQKFFDAWLNGNVKIK